MKHMQELTNPSLASESKEDTPKEQKSFILSVFELSKLDVYDLPFSGYVYIGAHFDRSNSDESIEMNLLEGIENTIS